MTILLVCAGEQRLNRLKSAIHSAGFPIVSAQALDQAWARTEFFDFGAVLIDHELKNDTAASAFRQRFMTLNLDEDTAVVMELTNHVQSRLGAGAVTNDTFRGNNFRIVDHSGVMRPPLSRPSSTR